MNQEHQDVRISAQVTPNPNTLKFMVDQSLIDSGTYNFTEKEAAVGSRLPEELFHIDHIEGVMIGPNFVSITKSMDVDWSDLAEAIMETLKSVISSGEELIGETAKTAHQSAGEDSEVVQKIKTILDNEIRPAVAMDGGDITFHSYNEGILTLHLQGACSTCPSSVMTLKMGVENRLKEDIPELVEVVQV